MVIQMMMVYAIMRRFLVVKIPRHVTTIQFIQMMQEIASGQLIMVGVTVTATYSMSVAFVAVQVSQQATVTATATNSMSVAYAVVQVFQQETVTAMATNSMSVAYVADQVFQREIVTAKATN
jgi:hypothetical protein